ncbi:MAG: DUF4058 family protein [Planctomycetaceae bacterium]
MKSKFPGMDPFLEAQEWEDFHTTFNTVLREYLGPSLEPDYLVRVERRVYVEAVGVEPETMRQADVAIVAVDSGPATGRRSHDAGSITAECELPMPIERQETYLVIRDRETMKVVTVIEVLSPSNKRRNGDGRREYLTKRVEILSSPTHLVELDLLRGGMRLPVVGSLPPGDYYAIVSRVKRRPRCDVYAWTLHDSLPSIPIPLKPGDDDAIVPLQEVFDTVYQRARYDLSIKYDATLDPPLNESELQLLTQQR